MWAYEYADELYHYGVKGQKWGVRRYQDYNGRLKRGHEKRYGEWPPKGRNTEYQKKNGSLTRAGRRELRKMIDEEKLVDKYGEMRSRKSELDKAREAARPENDKSKKLKYDWDSDTWITENDMKVDKANTAYTKSHNSYRESQRKVYENFLNKYGNKRVSEVSKEYEKSRVEINKLLENVKKDLEDWNANMDTVRRNTAYRDEKQLQTEAYNREYNNAVDNALLNAYGITQRGNVKTATNKPSKYEKRLQKTVNKNKRKGYY